MKNSIPGFSQAGLNDQEVIASRLQHGINSITADEKSAFKVLKELLDPMVLLLIAAAVIYLVSGRISDSLFMIFSIALITMISLYQNRRSRVALESLKALTQPQCRVVRNNQIRKIGVDEVVVDDYLIADEGSLVAADGIIVQSNDFAVNESIITGESVAVEKNTQSIDKMIYRGTSVTRGLAVCKVTAVGKNTEIGKIGAHVVAMQTTETPLQKQIRSFVLRMAIIGGIFLIAVWSIDFYRSGNMLNSLLKALSLAMSILPEEIPVAFTTFMALGAWHLAKLGIIVKETTTIETLGAATVICIDKTGTITKNQMQLGEVYTYGDDVRSHLHSGSYARELIRYAMWASEPIPFDPMEIELHRKYAELTAHDERTEYKMIHEYPLAGNPPFMTHIFENSTGDRIVAAKGAPEAIFHACALGEEIERLNAMVQKISSNGVRVLGVATGNWSSGDFPDNQSSIPFKFLGLVSFFDPPKENMTRVLQDFYDAGIQVKIVTGDYPQTTKAIASQINFRGEEVLTGSELSALGDDELHNKVEEVNIFARMFPEAKLRILNALKGNGHIVAMTGDGVNDAPALKAAHIGIAMGKKGAELAKESAALVLSDDDLAKMVDAIAAGRRIYANLKKAIQYIISIHFAIILVVFIPLVLSWTFPFLFSPVHIIFFELIMGPTCSIIYENEPIESRLMDQKPRKITTSFFGTKELMWSIVQGTAILTGALYIYHYSISENFNEDQTRTMVFVLIVFANIFLTLVNRSLNRPFWISIRYKNKLMPLIVLLTLALMVMILSVAPIRDLFQMEVPSLTALAFSLLVGFISVVWIDVVKIIRPLLT